MARTAWHEGSTEELCARSRREASLFLMTPRDAARLLLRARQALLLAAFALSGVWAWRHQGLFGLFADTQMRLTGGYDAFFALPFTFLTLFVVSMALGSVLTALMRRRFSKEDWQTLLNDTTKLWDASWWKGR
jgi:hypothetical protein